MQKEFVPLEPYVWIKTGAQLVVRPLGIGEEVLGKWSGSLKGLTTAELLEYNPKNQAETSSERPSKKWGETTDTCYLQLPD